MSDSHEHTPADPWPTTRPDCLLSGRVESGRAFGQPRTVVIVDEMAEMLRARDDASPAERRRLRRAARAIQRSLRQARRSRP